MKIKVVTWATGNVGKYAVRAVVNHPDLELVGHIVSNPDKTGIDVAELAQLNEPTGIYANHDIEAVLKLRPDCVVYTAHSETRMLEAAQDQARCLAMGINVVASSLFMLQYPNSPDVQWLAEPIKEACKKGRATCFNNGIDPGFANDTMPLVFTSLSEYWSSIRMQEIINYSTYDQEHTIREIMGFGYPTDHGCMFYDPGVLSMAWGGSVRAVAAALGVEVERVYEVSERLPLEEDASNAMGVFKKGMTGAVRFEVRAVVGGHDAIVLEHVTRLVDDIAPHWPHGKGYKVIIEGEPKMTISMDMEDRHGDHAVAGVIQTATLLVNSIPAVVQHAPGLVTAYDLPKVCGRNLYRAPVV